MAILCKDGVMKRPSLQQVQKELGRKHTNRNGAGKEYDKNPTQQNERPAAPGPRGSGLTKMVLEQRHVLDIRFPCYVEQIAQDRDPSYPGVNRNVRDHSTHHRLW